MSRQSVTTVLSVILVLTSVAVIPAFAGTFNAFGPQTYQRHHGKPVTVTSNFSVLNPSTTYTLQVVASSIDEDNDGDSDKSDPHALAHITLNDQLVLKLHQRDGTQVSVPVRLQASNQIGVEVRGKPGGTITVTIVGIDNDPPVVAAVVSPPPNAAHWNNSNVKVTFTCSDATSGIASCPAPVTVATEGAGQVISGTAIDLAGNEATATVTLNIDKTNPTITASASPPLNGDNWINVPVTISFQCADSLSGIASCPVAQTVSTDGANQVVTGVATDIAGNTASTSITLNIDQQVPSIRAVASPVPNPNLWNNTNVTVSFQCSDNGPDTVNCPGPQVISGEGAKQVINGTVTDIAGNLATTSAVVSIDKTPPQINVTSPADQSNVGAGQVTIQGLVSDALSGISGVNCNGSAAALTGTAFSCNVTLAPGSNAVAITASDLAGNTTSTKHTLIYATPIKVQITAPTSLQLFSANPLTVAGTVDNPNAVITVANATATLSNGTFTATGVTLREGKNLVTASATTPDGGVGSDSVTVYLDTTPPVVHIDSPADGAVVTAPQIDVTGNVNDLVTGTVNGDQVAVTVNGVISEVANRSFAAHNILLVPGVNTITAVAKDRAGNTNQHQVRVTLQQFGGQQALSIVSGNNQSGPINTILPQPLVVHASDAIGRPIANQALSFSVAKSDGFIISGQQRDRGLTVQTDGNGNASVQFQLGSRNGAGVNQVAVTAPGFVAKAVFCANSAVGIPTQIHTVSGEIQKGAVGAALPEPLVAIVFDAGGNPVPNIPVTFAVQSGGGLLNGQAMFTQNTDGDGKAYAVLVLGQQEGISNNAVSASFTGLTAQSAVFTSSGVVPGPAANTTVSGIVLDNANLPIPDATASIKGTFLSALTNPSGRFTIPNAPVGNIVLYVDGSGAKRVESFPTLSFQMVTIPGIDNTLPGPIYLPPIDKDNSQLVGGDQDVVLTMKGVPGVAYKVFARSVTFPNGDRSGSISLSQVHADKVPMTPPNGTAPRLVATVQPTGVKFDPPIQMTLPNTDGLAPGQVIEIFSFHHDVEQFVTEGTARVSDDGSLIVSDPGFGLTVSGWDGAGGNSQPADPQHDCDDKDACTTDSWDGKQCHNDPPKLSKDCCHFDPTDKTKNQIYDALPQCCVTQNALDHAANPLPGGTPGIYPRNPVTKLENCPERAGDPTKTHRYNGCSIPPLAQISLSILGKSKGNNDPLGNGNSTFSVCPSGWPPSGPSCPQALAFLPPNFAPDNFVDDGPPCDIHDECFQTCDHTFSECNARFNGLANDVCAASHDPTGCRIWAKVYEIAIANFGGGAYKRDQLEFCQCCDSYPVNVQNNSQ